MGKNLTFSVFVLLALLCLSTNLAFATSILPSDSIGLRNNGSGAFLLGFENVNSYSEDRTITHFNISTLAGIVNNATLNLQVYSIDLNGVLEIYSFPGDGTVSTDEWNSGTIFNTVTSIPQNVYHNLSINITSLLQSYIDSSDSYISFNFRGVSSRIGLGDSGIYGTEGISIDYDIAPVPEPGTMLLLGSGLVGLMGYGRKRFKK